jgi:hypothetical protein
VVSNRWKLAHVDPAECANRLVMCIIEALPLLNMFLKDVLMHYLLAPRAFSELCFLITVGHPVIAQARNFNHLLTVGTRGKEETIL